MKIKLCSLFIILSFLLVLTSLAVAAPTPGSPCTTHSGKAGRWFGTPNNMVCAGLGDSCPAPNGPGKVFGTPNNMVCAGLGDSCPAQNGQGVVTGTADNMKCTASNTGGGGSNANTQPKLPLPGGSGLNSGPRPPGGFSR